jgi:hypothetical protein
MSHPPRLTYAGALHRINARDNRHGTIFLDNPGPALFKPPIEVESKFPGNS